MRVCRETKVGVAMVITQLHIVMHETTWMFRDNTVSPSVSGEWASLWLSC